MASGIKDTRKKPRIMIRALVDYESQGTYFYDYSTNLSEGGLFIETENVMPVGAQVTLRFTLPNIEYVFEVLGVVKWINLDEKQNPKILKGMGVGFQSMDDKDRELLDEFIQKEAQKQSTSS